MRKVILQKTVSTRGKIIENFALEDLIITYKYSKFNDY